MMKRTRETKASTRLTVVGLALVLFGHSSLYGALIISESFDYGDSDMPLSTSTSTLNGGTGLSGSWALPSTSNTNNRGAYIADGLSFGRMPTSGGALRVEAQWAGSSLVSRAIAVNVSGTLWGGWLVQTFDDEVVDPNSNRTSVSVGAASGENGYPADMDIAAKGWNAPGGAAAVKIGRDSGGATASGGVPFAFDGSTTYLMLMKAEGLGDAGAKAITLWALNGDQFDYLLANNSLMEASLNSAALGSDANQVMQRVSQTKASGTADFDETQWLSLVGQKGTASSYLWYTVYDEIRFSTASGDEGLLHVTGIPEPASITLLALAGAALCARRRRPR